MNKRLDISNGAVTGVDANGSSGNNKRYCTSKWKLCTEICHRSVKEISHMDSRVDNEAGFKYLYPRVANFIKSLEILE